MDAPPILRPRGRPTGWWIHGLWVGLALLVLGILWGFNPSHSPFYPRCLLYTSTGIQCPGCGGLRATHHLLHGHFAMAFAHNALAVTLLPFATSLGILLLYRHWKYPGTPVPWTHYIPYGLLAGATAGFTLARNLPLARWLGW